jgi:hypothetical protein
MLFALEGIRLTLATNFKCLTTIVCAVNGASVAGRNPCTFDYDPVICCDQ